MRFGSFLALRLLGLVCLWGASTNGYAQPLFDVVPTSPALTEALYEHELLAGNRDTVKASWAVHFNEPFVSALFSDHGLREAARVAIPIPHADVREAVIERQEAYSNVPVLVGQFPKSPHATFYLAMDGGAAFMFVDLGSQKFVLRPSLSDATETLYVLEELNIEKFGEGWSDRIVNAVTSESAKRNHTGPNSSTKTAYSSVNVSIFLSPEVALENAPVNAWVATLFASVNQSFVSTQSPRDAGVRAEISSSSSWQTLTAFSEPSLGSMTFVLNSIACESAPGLSGIRVAMDSAPEASIGVMIVDDDLMQSTIRGAAFFYNEILPFAVVQDDWAIGDYTLAHEMGHIFGGAHPSSTNSVFAEGHGLDNHPDWQTVMGAYDSCNVFDPGYPFCAYPRQNFWSNPGKVFQGDPAGAAGSSNMRVVLNATLPLVETWWQSRASNSDWVNLPPGC